MLISTLNSINVQLEFLQGTSSQFNTFRIMVTLELAFISKCIFEPPLPLLWLGYGCSSIILEVSVLHIIYSGNKFCEFYAVLILPIYWCWLFTLPLPGDSLRGSKGLRNQCSEIILNSSGQCLWNRLWQATLQDLMDSTLVFSQSMINR